MPAPAFVIIAAEEPLLIMPVIAPAPLLVIARVPWTLIAVASNAAVPIVVFPKAADPPTASENVTAPDPATMSKVLVVLSLISVPEKVRLLSPVVKVILPPNVAFSP